MISSKTVILTNKDYELGSNSLKKNQTIEEWEILEQIPFLSSA